MYAMLTLEEIKIVKALTGLLDKKKPPVLQTRCFITPSAPLSSSLNVLSSE